MTSPPAPKPPSPSVLGVGGDKLALMGALLLLVHGWGNHCRLEFFPKIRKKKSNGRKIYFFAWASHLALTSNI
jgi:hypothetical protein